MFHTSIFSPGARNENNFSRNHSLRVITRKIIIVSQQEIDKKSKETGRQSQTFDVNMSAAPSLTASDDVQHGLKTVDRPQNDFWQLNKIRVVQGEEILRMLLRNKGRGIWKHAFPISYNKPDSAENLV